MQTYFTAKSVHQALPWISGTSLFNRVKAGLIPYVSGGNDVPYKFRLSGLVHVGVIDELLSFGAWKSGVSGTTPEIDFFPAPSIQRQFETSPVKGDHERALHFYELHDFDCRVYIDIKHSVTEIKVSRRSRATRTFYMSFRPDLKEFPDAEPHTPLTQGLDVVDGRVGPFVCFSSATIDVSRIYRRIVTELGL
jgi:hypothetical protein